MGMEAWKPFGSRFRECSRRFRYGAAETVPPWEESTLPDLALMGLTS
ncbi:hypothetical protein GCM10023237_30010 [Streptomyces coeruleoprunus]